MKAVFVFAVLWTLAMPAIAAGIGDTERAWHEIMQRQEDRLKNEPPPPGPPSGPILKKGALPKKAK